MKRHSVIWVICLISSFNCFGQNFWEGEYYVSYEKELVVPRESKVSIWKSNDQGVDSSKQQKWSFKAFQNNKLVWEWVGYTMAIDTNLIELYVESYQDYRPKKEKKVSRKVDKYKPFYVLRKQGDSFFIKATTAKRKKELKLVRVI